MPDNLANQANMEAKKSGKKQPIISPEPTFIHDNMRQQC